MNVALCMQILRDRDCAKCVVMNVFWQHHQDRTQNFRGGQDRPPLNERTGILNGSGDVTLLLPPCLLELVLKTGGFERTNVVVP